MGIVGQGRTTDGKEGTTGWPDQMDGARRMGRISDGRPDGKKLKYGLNGEMVWPRWNRQTDVGQKRVDQTD